jgi:hypothetical protein
MSEEKGQSRWEVTIVRETVDEATIYVSGRSQDEAWEEADREFMDGGVYDFETIWSEYTLEVAKVDPRHEADPVHWFPDQGAVCKICLTTVVWTGTAADDPENRSGVTIPGPWVHAGTDRDR